jgi:predicted dehydrogenase
VFRYLLGALLLASGLVCVTESGRSDEPKMLRAGIIGLDTSHVTAFTSVLNASNPKPGLAGVRIVAAYPGGSQDIPDSKNRLEMFTKTLKEKHGVEIVSSIDELLPKVDVVFLESVDGRPHLEQVKPVLKAGKPVFIDKPVAGSLADAIQIYDLAKQHKVPVFSSSSLRFSASLQALRDSKEVGEIVGCDTYGPCSLEAHHPDLYWYGVHGVEMLYTIMGTGCESVARTQTKGTELVTGTWKGGRVGTFRGIREGKSGYGGTVFGTKQIAPIGKYDGYEPLLVEICKFFRTGQPPVSAEETVEMFAFMEAADESKRQGGAPVKIADVMQKARDEIAKKNAK